MHILVSLRNEMFRRSVIPGLPAIISHGFLDRRVNEFSESDGRKYSVLIV